MSIMPLNYATELASLEVEDDVEIIEVENILCPKEGDSFSKKRCSALEESADSSSADEKTGGLDDIPLYCVVKNTPPSNRIRQNIVSSENIWTCMKRLKGVLATRERSPCRQNLCLSCVP